MKNHADNDVENHEDTIESQTHCPSEWVQSVMSKHCSIIAPEMKAAENHADNPSRVDDEPDNNADTIDR